MYAVKNTFRIMSHIDVTSVRTGALMSLLISFPAKTYNISALNIEALFVSLLFGMICS